MRLRPVSEFGRPLFSFRLACVALRRGYCKLSLRVPHTYSRALELKLILYQIDVRINMISLTCGATCGQRFGHGNSRRNYRASS
jgi:hypothetical protein